MFWKIREKILKNSENLKIFLQKKPKVYLKFFVKHSFVEIKIPEQTIMKNETLEIFL